MRSTFDGAGGARARRLTLCAAVSTGALIVTVGILAVQASAGRSVDGRVGVAATGAPGVEQTTADLTATSRAAGNRPGAARLVPRRVSRGFLARASERRSVLPESIFSPSRLLAVSTSFDGPTFADSSFFPPDSDAAAGTSQVLVALNGRIRVYGKNGTAGALNATLDTFFASVITAGSQTVDPRVVFDTITRRWFVSAIDVPASGGSNRVMLAVSDNDTITGSTVWTFFQFQHDTIGTPGDTGDLADFPTLGVDQNAVYIGAGIFATTGSLGQKNTAVYVIKKASVLGAGPIVVTPFRNLIADIGNFSPGMLAPQGATNGDASATVGYIVATDDEQFGKLNVRKVTNPGSNAPTLSADIGVTVNETFYPGSEQGDGIRVLGSSTKLDATDDRLSAAMVQNGKLYAAQAIGIVNSTGTVASFANPPSTFPTRTGVRWYELTGLATTPVVGRQGTIFDSTTNTNPKSYWMPSIAVSRQGHAVIGMSSGGAAARPNGAVSSMLAGQSSFTVPANYTASAANYNVGAQGSLLRWGDYSMTTVDPCDGQTFWTIQEYVQSLDTWGVKIGKVPAPGPATPATLSPSTVAAGQASVDVVVTGTSASGSGFWDPGSGTCRIAAAITGGVTVNSVTFTDATHVTINVSTVGATAGASHDLTVTNPDGQTASKVGALSVSAPPASTGAPTISGTPQNGSVLTAAPGTWTGFPAPTFTYQFERCDDVGASCSPFGAASATNTYTLVSPTDTGKTMRVKVTASNGVLPTGTAESAPTAQVAGPPVSTLAPALSGTPTSGSALSTTNGTWTAFPVPTFGYEWLRCDAAGTTCVTIPGQTASSYTLGSTDVGKTVRSRVTATNTRGAVAHQSTQSVVVSGPPANMALPGISGTQKVGSVLTASNGTWSGFPVPASFAYQWERCDSSGASCVDIGSATNPTYTLVSADGGQTIRIEVTASNGVPPDAVAESAATGLIAVPPLNTGLPTVTGTAAQGSTLTAGNGTWDGVPTPTFTHQWLRCDSGGLNCVTIAAATGSTYPVVAADAGKTIRVDVKGTNASGSSTARSAQTTAVTAPPANTALPGVTGLTQVGATLTASNGTWTGFPVPTFGYRWQRCDAAGANCADIALNATAATYVTVGADAGVKLRVAVTGTNSTTAVTAFSAVTAVITVPPGNTVPPSITGTAAVGSLLTGVDGTWTGSPTPTLARQWRRCDTSGNTCSNVAGATGTTYAPVQADAGSTIRFRVTASNANGSTSADSTQSATVTGPPVNSVLPGITGQASRGQALTASTGTWSGFPVPTFAYQWRRCNSSGASCVDIASQTNPTYTVVTLDVGGTLRVVVTASNGATANATSAATAVVKAAPLNLTPPIVTGTADAGQILTASQGTWDASPTVSSYAYQWFRCDDGAGNGCVAIGGATASAYTLVKADAGHTVKVRVTASNGVNPAGTADSALTTVVTGAPSATIPPVITGTTNPGDTLSTSTGTWFGNPAPTFTYKWESCNAVPLGGCSFIAGETGSTYVIVNADKGHQIRSWVTATNSAGSDSGFSAFLGIPGPPVNLTAPSITGTARTGSTLTAGTGSWLGIPFPTFTYQWERCDAAGATCSDIGLAVLPTYSPTAVDLGMTIRVRVGASNTGGSVPPIESAQTAVVTTPPSTGGGGGGGGASDLVAAITAPALANVGDGFTYFVTAQDVGTGSENVVATITLPAGVALGAIQFDRGQGCTGTTVLTCKLDFLNGALVAHVNVSVQVTTAGSLVATVVLSSNMTDVNPPNNTATATTLVTPVVPVLPAPKVARTGSGTVTPVRSGKTASVRFGASINRAARVRMTVKRQGGARPLLLRAGSRVGSTPTTSSSYDVTSAQRAGSFTVKAVFGQRALRKGQKYVVTLVATTPEGRASTLTVAFKG